MAEIFNCDLKRFGFLYIPRKGLKVFSLNSSFDILALFFPPPFSLLPFPFRLYLFLLFYQNVIIKWKISKVQMAGRKRILNPE